MTIRSDNTATACNLQRQGAGKPLLKLTREIFKKLMMNIRVTAMHMLGVENVLTDALSRMEATGDYELKTEAVRLLQVYPTIDLFASRKNAKSERFVVRPGPLQQGAMAVDAFSLPSWDLGVLYLFPPVQVIDRVLQRLQMEKIKVQKWTSQPWWNLFAGMAKSTVELGKMADVLVPGPLMTASKSKAQLPPGNPIMAVVEPN
jgi:hypothetical protein